MADEFLILGGVRLNKADVKSYRETVVKNSYGKSEKRFVVVFKNSTQVAFRAGNGGSISSTLNKTTENISTNIYGVMGLEIKGSQKYRDEINVSNSEVIGIDVTDGGGYDEVTITNSKSRRVSQFGVEHESALDTGKGALPPILGDIKSDKGDHIIIDERSKNSGIHRK